MGGGGGRGEKEETEGERRDKIKKKEDTRGMNKKEEIKKKLRLEIALWATSRLMKQDFI